MTAPLDEAALRRWLVDYLITNMGCDAADIDLDASFSDLGIGSRKAVVLSGELAELVGRAVSPVEFWQHPTINSLIEYLTTPESEIQAVTAGFGRAKLGRRTGRCDRVGMSFSRRYCWAGSVLAVFV